MQPKQLRGDASTLIDLAKADAFTDARSCIDGIQVPPSVWRETVADAERLSYPDVPRIRQAAKEGFLTRIELDDAAQALAGTIATEHRLGVGESEALALGREDGRALLDDGRAARVASALGIIAVSTLFLPVLGRLDCGLDRAAAIGFLRRLAIVTGARADTVYEIEKFIEEVTR